MMCSFLTCLRICLVFLSLQAQGSRVILGDIVFPAMSTQSCCDDHDMTDNPENILQERTENGNFSEACTFILVERFHILKLCVQNTVGKPQPVLII